jgi:ring-1,2-phenylacetyl-CoA epoxidase subunit PaaD
MVTSEQVWEALAEIPDPEIPTISLVDLGVVRGVDVSNGTVHVRFTPTFLGCPAVEVMQRLMAERIRDLGAEPEIEVAEEGWSSDWITAEGRRKLRESGFAPPLGSAELRRAGQAPPLLQIQTAAHRCPYCGSDNTRLDNLFGPTPCRSIRYCNSCRQPFEQFKTL